MAETKYSTSVIEHPPLQRWEPDRYRLPCASHLAIGVPAIDADHEELTDAHNALVSALAFGSDLSEYRRRFRGLIERARRHFIAEEGLMMAAGYPELAKHRAEHAKLVRDAEDFATSIDSRFDRDDCTAVAQFLKYWLLNHVERCDRRLGQYLLARA